MKKYSSIHWSNKGKFIHFAFFAVFLLASVPILGCSRRVEKNPMKIGETITILPMKANSLSLTQKPKHVRLVFDIGGKMMSGDEPVQIQMYETMASKTPVQTLNNRELGDAHKSTRCPDDVYRATKDAMVGDVLFCNRSLEIDSLHYFVAKREGKDDKIATNALLEYEDAATGLASYVISFQ